MTSVAKTFFSKFLQYLTYFLILSGTNFITNMEPASEKKKTLSISLWKCQQEAVIQYWLPDFVTV